MVWAALAATALVGSFARAADNPGLPTGTSERPIGVRFGFESGTTDGWCVTHGDLGRFLCDRPTWYDGKPFGKSGRYFLSTIETRTGPWNDGFTGHAESPVFVPTGPDMSFLLGGGDVPTVYVALCQLDGTVLARATGHNSHIMRRVDWRVPAAVGKPVVLRIVDGHRESYGWLTFDEFRADFIISRRYGGAKGCADILASRAQHFHGADRVFQYAAGCALPPGMSRANNACLGIGKKNRAAIGSLHPERNPGTRGDHRVGARSFVRQFRAGYRRNIA